MTNKTEFFIAGGDSWDLGLNLRNWKIGVEWTDTDTEIQVGPFSLLVWAD